jgi:hypothetical protein
MTLEQFSKDCEQATVPMRLIPSSLQKISLVISGAPLPCHQMFSKPAARLFVHFVSSLTCSVGFSFLTDASIQSRLDWSKLTPLARGLKHNTGPRSARVPKIVRRHSRRWPTAENPIRVRQFPPRQPRFCRQPTMGSLRAIHHRFCRSPLTHLRLYPEKHHHHRTTCTVLR